MMDDQPEGLEMERTFGSQLEALVVYYQQEQHMSYYALIWLCFTCTGSQLVKAR